MIFSGILFRDLFDFYLRHNLSPSGIRMTYNYIKALHIIFIVTWFAGLFYIVRLFVYHTEAYQKAEPERQILVKQYKLMARRLWWGITWPSAIITLLFGGYFLHVYAFAMPTWLFVKLIFVIGLYGYHLYCHRIFRKLQMDIPLFTSQQLRMWNEVSTVFLISIVFLAVLKNTLSMVWGLLGLFIFTLILLLAIRIYKKIRERN
jgi:putative membrane protein